MTHMFARHVLAPRAVAAFLLASAASLAVTCSAAEAFESYAPAPVVPLATQPAPRLFVDEPLPESLAKGLVVIRYRAKNLRIVPVYGPAALDVSPRIGHIHVTIDDAPWHWADASGEPLIIQGLPAGPHRVRIDLANPTHRVIQTRTVDLVIPANVADHH